MGLSKHIIKEVSDAKRKALYDIYLKTSSPSDDDQTKKIEFDFLLSLDETPNKQYAQWLLTKGLAGDKFYALKYSSDEKNYVVFDTEDKIEEDKEKIREYIMTHFNAKQRGDFPKEYKDINNVPTVSKLKNIVLPFMVKKDKTINYEELIRTTLKVGKQYEIIHDDAETAIYRPLTVKGACVLGAESDWCTSYGKYSLNPEHKKRGNAFLNYAGNMNTMFVIFIKESNERFQLDYWSEQLMDLEDNSVYVTDVITVMSEASIEALYNNLNDESVVGFDNDLIDYSEKVIKFSGEYIAEEIMTVDLSPYTGLDGEYNMYAHSGAMLRLFNNNLIDFIDGDGDVYERVYNMLENEDGSMREEQLFKLTSAFVKDIIEVGKSKGIKYNKTINNVVIESRPITTLVLLYIFVRIIYLLLKKIEWNTKIAIRTDSFYSYLENPDKLITDLKSVSSVDSDSITFDLQNDYNTLLSFMLRRCGDGINMKNRKIALPENDKSASILVDTYFNQIQSKLQDIGLNLTKFE